MFGTSREQQGGSQVREPAGRERTRRSGAPGRPVSETAAFRVARLVYGGVLALMAVDNFRNLEGMVGYAESRGAPAPGVSVPAISGTLLFGGVGVALWRVPVLAAGAVSTFFLTVTPVMHDFWTLDDPEERQQQTVHFLKNSALLGAALAFLTVADRE